MSSLICLCISENRLVLNHRVATGIINSNSYHHIHCTHGNSSYKVPFTAFITVLFLFSLKLKNVHHNPCVREGSHSCGNWKVVSLPLHQTRLSSLRVSQSFTLCWKLRSFSVWLTPDPAWL